MFDAVKIIYASGAPSSRALQTLLAIALLLLSTAAPAAEKVRVAVLQFGTVHWLLDVIEHHGLGQREGVAIEAVRLGSKDAVSVALQAGAADIIVSDWIWVSRQRADGHGYTFSPYSVALGGLLVRPDAGIRSLADLRGKRLGVAGGAVDKSWLLLRAYAKRALGDAIENLAEPTFAAPPLLNQLMFRAELPAVLNFWPYAARLEAAGMEPLIGVDDIMRELGVAGAVPMVGWVFHEAWALAHRDALIRFLRAAQAAERILAESDAEWERIRPLTKAEDDATLARLRQLYREGIPGPQTEAQFQVATRLYELLAQEGGAALVGRGAVLSPGTFWREFDARAADAAAR